VDISAPPEHFYSIYSSGGFMKRIAHCMLIIAFLQLLFAARAQSDEIKLDVKDYTLKNGMRVLIVPRHVKPTFRAYMMFDAGAIREGPGTTGIAHLLEHLMFKGTKDFGSWNYSEEEPLMKEMDSLADEWYAEKEKTRNAFGGGSPAKIKMLEEKMRSLLDKQRKYIISNEIQGIYSKNGSSGFNAFTGPEMVCYIISLPVNRLELWAAIESDRITSPVFREFYAERDVVNEERRMGDNSPSGRLWHEFYNMMYASCPYRNPVVGYESDITTVRRKDAESFFKRLYAPNNAVVAIVGDVDPHNVMELLKRYFEPIPARPLAEHTLTLEREQNGERRIEVEEDASPELIIGFHGPPMGSKEMYAFRVMSRILSSGRTSRLYRKLVKEKKIARSITTSLNASRFVTSFEVSGSPLAPHTTKELEEAIYSELELLKKVPADKKELEKILNLMEMDFVGSLRNDSSIAYMLTMTSLQTGDWKNFDDRVKLRSITPQDIMKAAEAYLTRSNRTVAMLTKASQGQKASTISGERKAPASGDAGEKAAKISAKSESHISPGAQRVAKLPVPPLKIEIPVLGKEIKRLKLSNGIVVYLHEDRSLPVVAMNLVFKDGAINEESADQGIAGITASMIRSGGTKLRSADRIDEDLDQSGALFSSAESAETSSFYFTTLSRNLDEGLALFQEAITEPAFQTDRLELRKSQLREDERRKNDAPPSMARREFYKVIFGDHPYAWINDICGPAIRKISRDDLVKWYQKHYTPDNAFIFINGDFDAGKMAEKLEKSFGAWKASGMGTSSIPDLRPVTTGGVCFIQKDLNQSIILMGHEGVDRFNGDRYSLEVMNYILGGGSFGSRLMKKIRSDEGLAYHVDSRFDMDYARGGVFSAFAQTKSESTRRVIDLLKKEIERMRTESVTAEELAWAKDSLVNRFVHLLDDSMGMRLMMLEIQGLAGDYFATYAAKIHAVTQDDVRNAAARHLHPDRLNILIVGDRKRLGGQLEGLGSFREIKLDEFNEGGGSGS
jgi:predicted Zn-dependent peptidase